MGLFSFTWQMGMLAGNSVSSSIQKYVAIYSARMIASVWHNAYDSMFQSYADLILFRSHRWTG